MRHAVLAILGVLLSADAAEADCGIPSWVGTPHDTYVPRTGTLYVHDESLTWESGNEQDVDPRWVKLAWENGEGTVRVVRLEGALAAIEYAGPANATLKIYDRWDQVSEFHLRDEWTGYRQPPRVIQYWHQQSSWSCSSSDLLAIQIDQPVAAIRVHWTINGHAVDYYEVPVNDASKTVLQLGKINCGGENMPVEQLYDGGGIELYAIMFDGREVRIDNMPEHISLTELGSVDERLLDRAMTLVPVPQVDIIQTAELTAQTRRADERSSRGLGILVLILAGAGVLAALMLIRRADAAQQPQP